MELGASLLGFVSKPWPISRPIQTLFCTREWTYNPKRCSCSFRTKVSFNNPSLPRVSGFRNEKNALGPIEQWSRKWSAFLLLVPFYSFFQKTHASAVHVRQRAETLFQSNHFNPGRVKEIADGVTTRWQGLVTRAEERHKLVTASLNFYKTAEQVSRKVCLPTWPHWPQQKSKQPLVSR